MVKQHGGQHGLQNLPEKPGCLLKQLKSVETAAKPSLVSEPPGWELAGVCSYSCQGSNVGESPEKAWSRKYTQKHPKKAAGYHGFKAMVETRFCYFPWRIQEAVGAQIPSLRIKLFGNSFLLKSLASPPLLLFFFSFVSVKLTALNTCCFCWVCVIENQVWHTADRWSQIMLLLRTTVPAHFLSEFLFEKIK